MVERKSAFLRPSDDSLWEEDKADIDKLSATTFVYNKNISLPIEEQRERLPIFKYKKHILYLLEKFQTVVLIGETGCGKSTQIPQYLYECGWCENNLKIGIAEPRRFCVTTLAKRVSEEQKCTLGSTVGYSIRFDDCHDPVNTKIKYMTEGILIREMMADPLLQQYSVIMLDEVHERNITTDILMGLLKKIMKKRKPLRLIVASATADAHFLKKFFEQNRNASEPDSDTAAILSAEGRTHPITIHYVNDPVPDYVLATVDCISKIHKYEPEGDILAFLTGSEEVDKAVSLLKDALTDSSNKHFTPLILPMYGSLPNSSQIKVFHYTPRGVRKIVISTNIAETSITIPGIVYVVDCGFVKLRWFNPKTYTDSLIVVPISKASANQRAGRAGRMKAGKVYRLYPEEEYDKLLDTTVPEMHRSDMSPAVLQLKALGIDNILRFSFPTPPPAENLLLGVELLYALGAIDDEGALTKPLGTTMAEFPLPPLHSKTLIKANEFSCTDEISSVLALLQVDNVFVKPYSGVNALKSRVEKRKFEVNEGDLVTLLNVYTAFTNASDPKAWCVKHFINYKGLRRAREIKTRMLTLLERFGIEKSSCKGNTETICKCIASGFFPNAAHLHSSGVYKTVRGSEELFIHPSSVLFTVEKPPAWVLYCELIETDKIYMRDITVVESTWLEELAPHFYHRAPTLSR